jgi:hypothetical protein
MFYQVFPVAADGAKRVARKLAWFLMPAKAAS